MSEQELILAEAKYQNQGFMNVSCIESALRCSELIASSNFCPKAMIGKPGDVLVALQMGQELGLKPMQSIQNIAVINGRPSLWGDAMLAVCRQSKDWEYITEEYDAANDAYVCTVKRKDEPPVVRSFSMVDAKTAGLLGKEGPWKTYPKRMMQMRARGFALRDCFSDVLRGIIIFEEASDFPEERKDFSDVGFKESNALRFINDSQLSTVRDLLIATDTKESAICKYLKIDCIEDMLEKDFKTTVRQLNVKIKKTQYSELPINKVLNGETLDGDS